MLDSSSSSWFYPKPTGDPGRDRNARTLQFACFLLGLAIGLVAISNVIAKQPRETLVVLLAVAGLVFAAIMNRAGKWTWAGRTAILAVLFTTILLVFEARDGFRSHAMLLFPGMLLISVMLLDRRSYLIAAGIVLLGVAALGIAERHGLAPAVTPPVRTPTGYASILFVDLNLLVMAVIGSRIARDAQSNVFDLRAGINRLSATNLELREAGEALRLNEERFRTLFENATVGIYRTTPVGRIEMANPALVRILGYESFADLANRNLEETGFEPEYPRSAFRNTLEKQGVIQGLEAAWTRRDGSTVSVRESARCARDEAGTVRFYEGIIEDITDRKQVEDALRQSERKFAAAFRSCPAAMSIIDTESGNCILDVNEAFEQASGYSRVELLGQRALELGIWTEPEEHAEAQRRFGTDGCLRNFEFHFRTRNGDIRTGLVSAEPMEVDGRRGAITCTIDITERKRAEAALGESEARLRDAQRLAKVGSWELDIATGRIRRSDEMFQFYGLAAGDPPDFSTFLSYVHPKDRGKIREAQSRAVSTSAPFETEFRLIRPSGEIRFVRSIVEAIKDERGIVVGFRGATQDITERVSATELLRESERCLLNAERIAHVGNWRWDLKSNHVSWSAELFRILGDPPDCTPTYERFISAVAPRDRELVTQWVKDCLEGRSRNAIEFQIARPDGELRTVTSAVEVALDDEGLPAHVSGTCQDITDAKRAQDESFARQKLESLGALASGIAHDFNNLLGGVLAQAELAFTECAAGIYPDEQLKSIREVAIRGSEIVRQLMIYAGKESDVPELIDVSKTVEEMMGLLRTTVSRHAALATDLDETLPAVKARASQIRQIVMNLVANASDAIKYSDGVIRLSTGFVTVGRGGADAAPGGLPDGDYVQLEVSDTGQGMSQETQARIFDPFFTTKSAGRGLGLAVVHGIVRSLHGEIRVVSEVGKGATFQILLPGAGAAAGASDGRVAGVDQAARPAREATVLVVEDEDPLRLAVGKMLDKAGFAVLEAANGSDAIELLRAKPGEIDLLLLDMTIPGATSSEVLAEGVQARADLKVILTSAYSEEMVRATLDAPQVRGFIRKPFRLGDLVRALRNALSS